MLTEVHPHLDDSAGNPWSPHEEPVSDEDQYWKFTIAEVEEGEVQGLQSPTSGKVIAFEADGEPAAWSEGIYVTPTPYECSAEAREDLSLAYGPGVRYPVPQPEEDARPTPFSLYGRPNHKNRTWPAFGRLGGGWEIIWPQPFELRNPSATCGNHPSPLRIDGYQAAPVDALGPASRHLFTWIRARGHQGGAPWMRSEGRRFLDDDSAEELPDEHLSDLTTERDFDPAEGVWLREEGEQLASAAGRSRKGWWWCISAAKWSPESTGGRHGYSFWGALWVDSKDGHRYIVGPHRPLELDVGFGDVPKEGGERAKVWWRMSLLIWTFKRLLASPAPGIRQFPIVQ